VLEITLANGFDRRTGKQIGIESGDPRAFGSYDELFQAFRRQLRHFTDIKIRGNNVIERLYAQYMPAPFLSVLVDDCIANGRDYHDGGPRYNTTYIMGTSPGSSPTASRPSGITCSTGAPPAWTSCSGHLTPILPVYEKLRLQLWNKTPKYGNDDAYRGRHPEGGVRRVLRRNQRPSQHKGRRVSRELSLHHVPCVFRIGDRGHAGWTAPRGNRSATAFRHSGGGPRGPTAVIQSAARLDHARTGGTLLNQKFSPRLVESESGLDHLAHLVRAYFKLDGHHIQFNIVTAETLREAQREPQKHRDLIVRVAGYSDYFCDLTPALQGEIIARTEQGGSSDTITRKRFPNEVPCGPAPIRAGPHRAPR